MAFIIGRKQEQKELRRLFESNEPEMVVVYGRRRVGKTYLVNQVFDQEGFSFKITGLYKSKLPIQLENFSLALREYYAEGTWPKPKSWMEAFGQLKDYLTKTKTGKKRVLFFDELPWMDTKGSHFLEAFEWFWNSWGSTQEDLLLIVCGSATNWIINKLFRHKGGLYNRAGSKIFLSQFTLAETEQYLQKRGFDWERYDIALIYMIMGGILSEGDEIYVNKRFTVGRWLFCYVPKYDIIAYCSSRVVEYKPFIHEIIKELIRNDYEAVEMVKNEYAGWTCPPPSN